MTQKKDWTVMIYMIGDNNLSIDMVYALGELQKQIVTDENDNLNLFVYYENNSPEIPPIYCDFSDAENPVYQYSNEIVDKFTSDNSLDIPNSKAIAPVLDFVDWCVNKVEHHKEDEVLNGRKSDKYALIFSGHTMGFLSLGLLKEETTNVSMTMPSLQNGLQTINDKIINQKLSILGFDSCVMSMFEVGNEFKEVAETMIASAGSIPNAGWSYSEVLSGLTNGDKDINVKNVAAEFVRKYIIKQSNYSIGGVSVDMAAWDLAKVTLLNKAIEKFAGEILECFNCEDSVTYNELKRIILQVHFNCQTYMFDQNIDLGDFCTLLVEELDSLRLEKTFEFEKRYSDLYALTENVLKAINECIILSGFSGGEYQYSTGISMFFPWSLSAYGVSIHDYQQLNFVDKTAAGKKWNQFLQKYLSEISLRKAKVLGSEHVSGTKTISKPNVPENSIST